MASSISEADAAHNPGALLPIADADMLRRRGSGLAGHGLSRTFDVVASLVLIAFLAPLLLLIALAVLASDRGPLIFGHRRIGLRGREFHCLKFRTMVVDAEAKLAEILATCSRSRREWETDHKLRVDPRLTPIGAFLRKTSFDELPQLFNVLRGEMSLVGPRPIVAAERIRYGRYFAHYCRVRPGITGLWQISGRNDTSYRRRVALDVAYVRIKSIRLDFFILVRTVPCVLVARGCY